MSRRFDLEKMESSFTQSLHSDGADVKLDDFLLAYDEIVVMFGQLGVVFGFVSHDVSSKISILRGYRSNGDQTEQYESVTTMITHEVESGKTTAPTPPSGSRTLLRLVRALLFVAKLFEQLQDAEPKDNFGPLCREAYETSLAEHHAWLVRKGATFAMGQIGTVEGLIKTILGEKLTIEETRAALTKSAATCRLVHTRLDKLYTDKDLHALP